MTPPLVIGNWKMHGDGGWLDRVAAIAELGTARSGVGIALCVPATLVHRAAAMRPDLAIGGQDCHHAAGGAHTGAISATMLREAGARLVIVGHSERRAAGDDAATVAAKVTMAHAAGLRVILCVGEDAAARADGEAVATACRQLSDALPSRPGGDLILAYEPVWAIGCGTLPAIGEIAPVIAALRVILADRGFPQAPVLYGGSVTAGAVPPLMAGPVLDGLLVGQASLDADALGDIVGAVRRSRRPA